jgi:hypothetical protein
MDVKHLISLEKWTLILAGGVIAVGMLLLGRGAAFGVTLGAGLMAANAYALRRIGERAFATFKQPKAVLLLFNVKMAVLIAAIFLVVRYLHVDPLAFVIGISVLPVAIVIVAIEHSLRPQGDSPVDPLGDRPSDNEETETHG